MTQQSGYNLPDKLYFRIGEVSDIVGVKPYVLRYWETEFSDIKPSKSKSGQRLYRKRDVELLLKIKDLLYTERFTINGAKQRLKEVGKPGDPTAVIQPSAPEDSSITTAVAKVVPEEVIHKVPEDGMLPFDDEVCTRTDDVIPRQTPPPPATVQASSVDKKFLEKMKADLEWCLSEMRVS